MAQLLLVGWEHPEPSTPGPSYVYPPRSHNVEDTLVKRAGRTPPESTDYIDLRRRPHGREPHIVEIPRAADMRWDLSRM